MKNKITRYVLLMILGVVLNLGLYEVAHIFHLPAWIDSIGTAYVAIVLEPAAGLLVAFGTNFFQSAFIYDSSSIVYYVVSAVAALSFGILIRKHGQINWRRIFVATITFVFAGAILSCLLTIWRNGGVPDSSWERHFYDIALAKGLPSWLSCFFGTLVLKVVDGIIMIIILPLFVKITPPSMVTETLDDPMITS